MKRSAQTERASGALSFRSTEEKIISMQVAAKAAKVT